MIVTAIDTTIRNGLFSLVDFVQIPFGANKFHHSRKYRIRSFASCSFFLCFFFSTICGYILASAKKWTDTNTCVYITNTKVYISTPNWPNKKGPQQPILAMVKIIFELGGPENRSGREEKQIKLNQNICKSCQNCFCLFSLLKITNIPGLFWIRNWYCFRVI